MNSTHRSNPLRLLVAGGGTGGHIYPALALIHRLREQFSDAEVRYVGTETGMEAKIVRNEGLPFVSIAAQGLPRKASPALLRALVVNGRGYRQARDIVRAFRPDVVLGTGGYACAAIVWAAHQAGQVTVIHEQNVLPGMTIRLLSHVADRVCLTFSQSVQYLPHATKDKWVVTGNPRAQEVAGWTRIEGAQVLGVDPHLPTLLIAGGSRGARPLNEAVTPLLATWLAREQWQVIYVTGEVHYDGIRASLAPALLQHPRLRLFPFLKEMPQAMACSDLLISRAGATTLAEVTAVGLPALFIPSPYVTANHQEINARMLVQEGAAQMLLESELTPQRLQNAVAELIHHPARLQQMATAARRLGQPRAADTLLAVLLEAVHVRR